MLGCGPVAYKTIHSIVDIDTKKAIKYADLITILTKHFDPKPSSIVQRFKFCNHTQTQGEMTAAYIASLCALAEH